MAPESNDFIKFKELWRLLGGEETNGVSVENLLYLLMIIRGADLASREEKFPTDKSKEFSLQRIAQINGDGKFIV